MRTPMPVGRVVLNAPRGTAGLQHGKDMRPTNVLARRAETDTPYLDDEDANAGRARCPQRAARNNQRTTSDRPVQTNHLAMARWMPIYEKFSISRRFY